MSQILTNNKNYYDIADTIRQMKEVNTTYKPREMASALKDIYSNEVEGVPPLTFESNGMDLLNYRIDGASGGVGDKTNNLFDLKKAVKKKYINSSGNEATSLSPSPENTLNHSDYVSIDSSVNYTFTCNTSQNYSLENTIALCWFDQNKNILSRNTMNVRGNISNYSITAPSPSTAKFLIINFIAYVDDAVFYLNEGTTTVFEPYGYKVPVVISGKNLFDEIYTNIVIGWDVKYKSIFVGEGIFTLSTTCPKQDDGNATNLFFLSGNVSTGANSATNGVYNNHPVTVTSLNGYVTIGYRAQSYDPRNYTTMLNAGTTALPYEPFTEPTTTNIYLDEPISENESISLSDTEVDIPTIEGTNVLTIDTTVQPSNVYVQSRKDNDEIVYLTTILEEGI